MTAAQADAVLRAAAHHAARLSDADLAGAPVPTSTRAQLLFDGAAWASAAVTLGAVAIFLGFTNAFEQAPEGKAGVLVTGLVFSAIAVALAALAKREQYTLGIQLAWSSVAILSPLIGWSLAWLLGLWPPADSSDTALSLAVLLLAFVPILAGAYITYRTHAALSFAVAVIGGHVAFVALWVLVGLPEPSVAVTWFGAWIYLGVAGAVAAWLERRARPFATWIHPLVCLGAAAVIGTTGEWISAEAALAVGLALLVLGATLAVVLQRMIYLAATVFGAIQWDVWLYRVLDLPPFAGLLLTLLLGVGGILLALAIWRRRLRRDAPQPGHAASTHA